MRVNVIFIIFLFSSSHDKIKMVVWRVEFTDKTLYGNRLINEVESPLIKLIKELNGTEKISAERHTNNRSQFNFHCVFAEKENQNDVDDDDNDERLFLSFSLFLHFSIANMIFRSVVDSKIRAQITCTKKKIHDNF